MCSMSRKRPARRVHLAKSLSVVVGVVMIWRGIWHVLDRLDATVFRGETLYTALGGIVLGLLILYLPDGDVKELDKL